MGGKLLLKLNMGTRPIANKYREGKMKSTLKRKLRVRETVSREAHGISNAGVKFRCLGVGFLRCYRSEGLYCVHYLAPASHFSRRCVNECSERLTRLLGR